VVGNAVRETAEEGRFVNGREEVGDLAFPGNVSTARPLFS